MTTKRARPRSIGDELVASMREAVAIAKGEAEPGRIYRAPEAVDVRAIRKRRGLTQTAFAARFGFPVATLRDWEQGRRRPDPAARTLLLVIDREPAAVERALAQATAP